MIARLDDRLSRLVAALLALGGAVVVASLAWALLAAGPAGSAGPGLSGLGGPVELPSPAAALLVASLAAVGDLSLLRIRFGQDENSFTLSEAALIIGLALVDLRWLAVLGSAGVVVQQLMMRREAHKALYNGAAYASGIPLAGLAFWGVSGGLPPVGDDLTWRNAAGLAVAAAVHYLWQSLAVSAAIAVSAGVPVLSVYRRSATLQLLILIGNSVLGLGVLVSGLGGVQLLVVPPLLVLLMVGYQSYLRAQQERDTWQQMQAASGDLVLRDEGAVARTAVERAAALFSAEYVELVLDHDGSAGRDAGPQAYRVGSVASGALGAEATLPPARQVPPPSGGTARDEQSWASTALRSAPSVVTLRTATPEQRAELDRLDLTAMLLAPLTSTDGPLGTLCIGFRGSVSVSLRERQVLSTFTSQVAAAVHNARLFEQVNGQRRRLSGILDSSSDGIFSVDAAGAVRAWNPAMARLTGRPTSDVLGVPLASALSARDTDGLPVTGSWLADRLAAAEEAEEQVSVDLPGGARRVVELALAAVRSGGGDLESTVAVARDVTARREAEQAKQDFLATVSHELRTPLTPIKGFLSLLLRPAYDPPPETVRSFHRQMLTAVDELERLVNELLEVSSLSRGDVSVTSRVVAVDEVAAAAIDRLRATTDRPVAHRRAGLAGLAVCDPDRLEQVLSNLLDNADKFSAAGAAVEVVVERVDGVVRVRVRDSGQGIPLDQLDAVFEPFRRLGDHLTRPTRGAGLGLHVARRLVEVMGGRLEAESQLGRGSTFTVVLPAAPLVASSATPASAAS